MVIPVRPWAMATVLFCATLPMASAFHAPQLLHPVSSPATLNGRFVHGGLPVVHGIRLKQPLTATMLAPALNPNKALPSYSKYGVIKIAGMDANVVIGLIFVVACFGVAAMLYPAILISAGLSTIFDKKRRRAVDWIVHWWAKLTCFFIFYAPKVTGLANLPDKSEAVMYIPNHCSYLDIFTMSGFLPRPFKYVSKIEILRIPLIGWAMQLAGHIAIRRMDKKSQLQTFKETIECLVDGNSIVTFAEGTRSRTGKLMPFKKGPIKMAIKAKKRIVPVSICNVYRWMPDTAVTPLGFPRGVEIKVHPPVDTVGRKEDDILQDVFDAVNSGLPEYQKFDPLVPAEVSEFSELSSQSELSSS